MSEKINVLKIIIAVLVTKQSMWKSMLIRNMIFTQNWRS